jgi:hypothetical protein
MNIPATRIAHWFLGIYFAALLCVIAFVLIHRPRVVYATPERQSAFLRNYSPNDTLKVSLASPETVGGGNNTSSESGPDAPKYKKVFEPRFAMPCDDGPRLTAALAHNSALAITNNGGHVAAIDGNDVEGFTLWYVDGRSTGKVTMTPVHAVEGAHWPRSGEVLATVKVTIDETWAKPQ